MFYYYRHLHTGNETDLKETVQIAQEALRDAPENHPDRSTLLSTWATITSKAGDAEESIRIRQQAIDVTPPDDPIRLERINNLAFELLKRFPRTRSMEDLEKAIHMSQGAVEKTPEDHPRRVKPLNTAAVALSMKYFLTHGKTALEKSRQFYITALDLVLANE